MSQHVTGNRFPRASTSPTNDKDTTGQETNTEHLSTVHKPLHNTTRRNGARTGTKDCAKDDNLPCRTHRSFCYKHTCGVPGGAGSVTEELRKPPPPCAAMCLR